MSLTRYGLVAWSDLAREFWLPDLPTVLTVSLTRYGLVAWSDLYREFWLPDLPTV